MKSQLLTRILCAGIVLVAVYGVACWFENIALADLAQGTITMEMGQ